MAASAKTILLKTRVGVDGEQTYRDALKNINRELKVLKTEMTAATSAFGNNQNSVEALTAKQQALSRQQEVHTEKVKRLSEMLELAKTKFADNTEVQDQYRIELANAQTALNKCSTELDGVSAALESAKQAQEDATNSTGEWSDSASNAADAAENMGEETEDAAKKSSTFASVLAGAAKTMAARWSPGPRLPPLRWPPWGLPPPLRSLPGLIWPRAPAVRR